MTMMRWGIAATAARRRLSCHQYPPNTTSPHWRTWLKPENRCLVPGQQLRGIRAGTEPETKKKDSRDVVCTERMGAPLERGEGAAAAPSPMMRCRSWRAAHTKKIAQQREEALGLLN